MPKQPKDRNEPYCSNCGYVLTGATESSKCPECGKPLVEVLMRPTFQRGDGKRFRSKARIFGMPVLDIAIGPSGEDTVGRARGFVAIGTEARGVLALGGRATGLVAAGGMAMGGFTFGGMSIGLFNAIGGMCIGGTAMGGFAIGGLAQGGGAVGVAAQGGMAVGYFARAGGAFGVHTIGPNSSSQAAQTAFDRLSWFFGSPPFTISSVGTSVAGVAAVALGVAAIIGLLAIWANGRDKIGEQSGFHP